VSMDRKQLPERLFGFDSLVKTAILLGMLVGGIALLAGRWDWWAGWAFVGAFTLYSLALFGWLAGVDPALARERQQDADPRNEPYERVLMPLMVTLEIALVVLAALDSGRFGWSAVPLAARIAGWLLLGVTGGVLPWVFHANTFASGVGRIQADRAHQVVTEGPYRIVRHPMYAGVILGMLGLPLALGSWWALVPGGLLAILFVMRTALEDRMLLRELPGYADYALRTRYRLAPGIW